jgi:hypothetical protein
VYTFPGKPGSSVLILTVNPDAGQSSATTFRSEAVYEFVIGSAPNQEDLCVHVLFSEPASDASQTLRVLAAAGADIVDRRRGIEVGSGTTGETSRLDFGGSSGSVWAGLAADPFWADGVALAGFLAGIAEGRYQPEIFDQHANVFDGRNVSALVLELPGQELGAGAVSVWARITLYGHACRPNRGVNVEGVTR